MAPPAEGESIKRFVERETLSDSISTPKVKKVPQRPNHAGAWCLWPMLLRGEKSFLSPRTSLKRGDVWRENVSSQETHRDPLTNEPIMIFNKLYCSVIHFLANLKKPRRKRENFLSLPPREPRASGARVAFLQLSSRINNIFMCLAVKPV
jgi:hypothetical protein